MTKALTLLVIIVAASVTWAADEAPRLPPSAQAILDSAERAIAANRAKYDEANRKPLADAEKELKAEQDRLGKAGKLEEALAIKKILASFGDELVTRVDGRAKGWGDLLGDQRSGVNPTKDDTIRFLTSHVFSIMDGKETSFSKDGTFTMSNHGNGTWKFGDRPNVIVVKWAQYGGAVETWTYQDGKLLHNNLGTFKILRRK